jgi:hypothetical protein
MPFIRPKGAGSIVGGGAPSAEYFRNADGVAYHSGVFEPQSGTSAAVAGNLFCAAPLFFGRSYEVTEMAVYCTALGVGGDVRIAIYDNFATDDPRPNNLIVESGALTPGAIGPVPFVLGVPIRLDEGALYWTAVNNSAGSSRQFSCFSTTGNVGMGAMFGRSATGTWNVDSQFIVSNASAFGPFPDPFVPAGAYIVNANTPVVSLRLLP